MLLGDDGGSGRRVTQQAGNAAQAELSLRLLPSQAEARLTAPHPMPHDAMLSQHAGISMPDTDAVHDVWIMQLMHAHDEEAAAAPAMTMQAAAEAGLAPAGDAGTAAADALGGPAGQAEVVAPHGAMAGDAAQAEGRPGAAEGGTAGNRGGEPGCSQGNAPQQSFLLSRRRSLRRAGSRCA